MAIKSLLVAFHFYSARPKRSAYVFFRSLEPGSNWPGMSGHGLGHHTIRIRNWRCRLLGAHRTDDKASAILVWCETKRCLRRSHRPTQRTARKPRDGKPPTASCRRRIAFVGWAG